MAPLPSFVVAHASCVGLGHALVPPCLVQVPVLAVPICPLTPCLKPQPSRGKEFLIFVNFKASSASLRFAVP